MVIPFAMLYYEGLDDTDSEVECHENQTSKFAFFRQFWYAVKWFVPFFLVLLVGGVILYLFFGRFQATKAYAELVKKVNFLLFNHHYHPTTCIVEIQSKKEN